MQPRRLPPIYTEPASHTQSSTNPSPFSPQSSQQPSSGQLQSRARIASSASSQPPASAAAALPTASQGGVSATGGGGGSTRIPRASPALSQTASPSSAANPSGLSRLVLTQIFILLGTINQEKDTVKRESQAEQISDMISQHGMDVYPKFFRRILQLNADYIFNNAAQPQGSYDLLTRYVQKIRIDPDEADKIAESIDTTEGELFKNFDVSKFMEHFKLDAVAKCMLALSLKNASKPDLRTKADAILANNYQHLLMIIASPTSEAGDDLPIAYLYSLLEHIIHDPPRNWTEESPANLVFVIRSRFDKLQSDVPPEIMNLLQLSALLDTTNLLLKLVQKSRPSATASFESCKEMLSHIDTRDVSITHIANVLLYMVLSQDLGMTYDATTFLNTLKDHRISKRTDWQDVVGSFDRPDLRISKRQFLALYHALLPLGQEYENFDIQLLWGGEWLNTETQLSFVAAFLSCSTDELDASTIPRLRKAYDLETFEDATDEVKAHAELAVRHPFVSLDATAALFSMIFESPEKYAKANSMRIPETIINPHTDYFVLATGAVPSPWGSLQSQAFNQLFTPFLRKRLPGDKFVFHGLWKRENNLWLASKFIEMYQQNPQDLYFIYEHANEHGWIPTLTSISNEFGVDLAALAHSQGTLDLEAWLDVQYNAIPAAFPTGLARIVEAKARSELAMQRDPTAPRTVQLSVKTVFGFLNFLQPHLPEESLVAVLKICINAYPRLINYGEGFDDVIEANGKEGHQLSSQADQIMNEHFKKLYNGDSKVRDVIEYLQRFKQSDNPQEQELFACMINGLFDEYNCFAEYPVDALSTTAVLFGGIINFNLLSSIALQVGLAMVLEAIQSSASREEKLYKFGLQALKQFQSRLADWPTFCERLLRIEELQETDVWIIAEDVVRNGRPDGEEHVTSPKLLPNGNGEDYAEVPSLGFSCIHADPPLHDSTYEAPSEDVQDKILFILNNVSPANIEEKQPGIMEVLEQKHHQWFAEYIVEERAKLQSNFQGLYLRLIDLFNDSLLWQEIIRETYVSVARLLNMEATMTSATEKNHLKSLGSWLGSITLARDVPIKIKNLSFKDLLIEANATKRLAIAIPFTAKVLAEATKSEIFQPPNPWTVEILRVLLELYTYSELRINLKFEIEALCGALKFDMKKAEPATVIRESEALADHGEFGTGIPEGLDGFHDMSLIPRPRVNRGSFSPASLAENLPDISQRLQYPPNSSTILADDQVHQVFAQAATQAITEIIYPVVERSVTIAAIAASQLVTKDYATESREDQLRDAAQNMVKSLSGSLAMVTCREPLRMSITNHVRNNSRTLPGDSFPEGVILMFVNDNIDVVCRVIEEAAEKYSVAEIENQIRDSIQLRQMHQQAQPDQPYSYPPPSKYAYAIPDPFKPSGYGNLSPEQLAIYENFGATRNIAGPHQGLGQDTRQQLPPDVIQEQFTSAIPTPAEAPAVLRQVPNSRMMNPQGISTPQPQLNGYSEPASLGERIEALYVELFRSARDAPEDSIKLLSPNSAVREFYDQLIQLVDASGNQRDQVALFIAGRLPITMYDEAEGRLEIEVAVQVLAHLCQLSMHAARQIILWLASLEDDRILSSPVTIHLVNARLMDLRKVDAIIAKGLRNRHEIAIVCLARFVDELLLSEHPLAIRANFASSFEVMTQWVHEDPNLDAGKELFDKLRIPTPSNEMATLSSNKQDEIEHIFEEWLQLSRPEATDKTVASFIHQLHHRDVLKNAEELAVFIRLCLDLSIMAYEQEEATPYGGSVDQAYIHIDALAGLIVALTVYHGVKTDGEVKLDSISFFDSMLSVAILYQCDHWKHRQDLANQKIFFRFYSSLLSEIHSLNSPYIQQSDLYLTVAQGFMAMQPNYLPGFAFAWLSLISHRIFIPAMLGMRNPIVNTDMDEDMTVSNLRKSTDQYLQLLHIVFDTATGLMNAPESGNPELYARGQDFYRGVLRLLVILHHDFPDFFSSNHLTLLNRLPDYFVQAKNLVLSAVPVQQAELPNPFAGSLKLDHIEEMLSAPAFREDYVNILNESGVMKSLESLLENAQPSQQGIANFCELLHESVSAPKKATIKGESYHRSIINAVVFHTGVKALELANGYNKSSPHAQLFQQLGQALDLDDRHLFVNAVVDQLRFPNSHTHWFMCALMDLFGVNTSSADELHGGLMELIVRTLIERLHVHRPHPWGVIVVLLELYKNPGYQFWELPFVKASPEVEKLFATLNNHIHQGPRPLAPV
ncbi:Not1-domain-containing protein [Microthyrium microscopicum]|uniref:General negative regulator of transcription subunit 1 n=1 Tax=Microthyrium microscopicum TaxID=703497 RepID=A0A6A6UKH1_9PEZI|nr:Not1-domain-containing protein [Microthyrium microscopicum]